MRGRRKEGTEERRMMKVTGDGVKERVQTRGAEVGERPQSGGKGKQGQGGIVKGKEMKGKGRDGGSKVEVERDEGGKA